MNKTQALASARPLEFLVTKEYRRFAEFCEACRRDRYIGLCYGPPGVGKTLSARRYAQWSTFEAHQLEYFEPPDSQLASCHSLYYLPAVSNTPRSIANAIDGLHFRFNCLVDQACRALGQETDVDRDYCELVLIDEADRLKMQSLEQLRDAYDRGNFGLIFILQRRKPRPLGVVRDKRLCLTKVLGLKHWAAVWARMAQVQIEAECAVIAAKPKHA